MSDQRNDLHPAREPTAPTPPPGRLAAGLLMAGFGGWLQYLALTWSTANARSFENPGIGLVCLAVAALGAGVGIPGAWLATSRRPAGVAVAVLATVLLAAGALLAPAFPQLRALL